MRLIVFIILGTVLGTPSARAMPTDQDMANLAGLMAGAFDSRAQNESQKASGVPEGDLHIRVTLFHRPLDIEGFGPHVFYNYEHRDGDPSKVIRQRIISLELDPAEDAIRMKQYLFHAPAKYLGAHLDPGLVSDVTQDDIWLLPGCDVFWTREGDVFKAAMKSMECVFAFPEGARERAVFYGITLDGDTFSRMDRSVYVDTGEVSGGRSDDLPTVHDRIAAPW